MSSPDIQNYDPYIKSYITDKNGKISDIIISYNDYKKIEEALLDYGLGKSMEEVADEEELTLEEFRKQINR
jgi:hypothetical protein